MSASLDAKVLAELGERKIIYAGDVGKWFGIRPLVAAASLKRLGWRRGQGEFAVFFAPKGEREEA